MTDPPLDPDHAAAVRTVRLVIAAVALVLVAGIAIVASGLLDGDEGAATTEDPTVLDGGAGLVGPPDGTALAAYVAQRQAALAEADDRRVAVVSLVSYRAETSITDLLDAAGGIEVDLLLVALPGGAPEAIDQSISSWVVDSRASLQGERDEIVALLPTIEDPDDPFIRSYLEEVAAIDVQLGALDPAGELVFGAVVRADAGALRRLAERPEVRLVDVAATDTPAAPSSYRGIRPDELDTAGTPPTRSG